MAHTNSGEDCGLPKRCLMPALKWCLQGRRAQLTPDLNSGPVQGFLACPLKAPEATEQTWVGDSKLPAWLDLSFVSAQTRRACVRVQASANEGLLGYEQ